MQICPRGASTQMDEIYATIFIARPYIYLFSSTQLQVRPLRGFLRTIAQTRQPQARFKPFRVKKFEINI